jgi:predicted XRE-type DNA-binding protein
MMMDAGKRKRLKEAGFKFGTVGELFDLSKADEEMIEVRMALANTLRSLRERHELSQERVAELLESGQARVSKVESADPSISLDFMVRAAFCLGATRGDLARAISPDKTAAHRRGRVRAAKTVADSAGGHRGTAGTARREAKAPG